MRKYAREVAFSMVYGYLMTGDREDKIPEELFDGRKLDSSDADFVFDVYNGVIGCADRYEELIGKYSEGFRSERIYRVDKALLLSAMSELETIKTPAPVVIDEIVSFAKKYSTEKSTGFINGILGSFVREREKRIAYEAAEEDKNRNFGIKLDPRSVKEGEILQKAFIPDEE